MIDFMFWYNFFKHYATLFIVAIAFLMIRLTMTASLGWQIATSVVTTLAVLWMLPIWEVKPRRLQLVVLFLAISANLHVFNITNDTPHYVLVISNVWVLLRYTNQLGLHHDLFL